MFHLQEILYEVAGMCIPYTEMYSSTGIPRQWGGCPDYLDDNPKQRRSFHGVVNTLRAAAVTYVCGGVATLRGGDSLHFCNNGCRAVSCSPEHF